MACSIIKSGSERMCVAGRSARWLFSQCARMIGFVTQPRMSRKPPVQSSMASMAAVFCCANAHSQELLSGAPVARMALADAIRPSILSRLKLSAAAGRTIGALACRTGPGGGVTPPNSERRRGSGA